MLRICYTLKESIYKYTSIVNEDYKKYVHFKEINWLFLFSCLDGNS